MSSGFVFPPPPPPPPPKAQESGLPTAGYNAGAPQHGRGHSHFRGRGRGRGSGFGNSRGGNGWNAPQRGPQSNSRRGIYGDYLSAQHNAKSAEASTVRYAETQAQSLKRSWSGSPKRQTSGGKAPPAVPSFGFQLPLPSEHSTTPAEAPTASKKRKGKTHNKLGLTPRTADPESSGEEIDADEEARLAAALRGESNQSGIQFEHLGQVMRLSTDAEIAAWIAERKRNYPTKARVAQALAQKAKEKEGRDARRSARRPTLWKHEPHGPKPASNHNSGYGRRDPVDRAVAEQAMVEHKAASTNSGYNVDRIQQKADELKHQLAALEQELSRSRAQQAVAPNEAKASKQHNNKCDTVGKANSGTHIDMSTARAIKKHKHKRSTHDEVLERPLTKEAFESLIAKEAQIDTQIEDEVSSTGLISSSDTLSEVSADDSTSSSDLSDSSGSGGEPEKQSSKVKEADGGVEALPPRPRTERGTCKFFAQRGQCRYGNRCRFSHDPQLPLGMSEAESRKQKPEVERITLYERLMARQQEEENEELLRYIIAFGTRGYFENKQGS